MTACMPFQGRIDADGYGIGRNGQMAHRLAYEAEHGPIPEGMVVDHLCRNRACCNPHHLEMVSVRENVMRSESFASVNASKTHCQHGHEFSPENTRVSSIKIRRPGGTIWYGTRRSCRSCDVRRQREYQQRKRNAA
jgi:hypothetical protein